MNIQSLFISCPTRIMANDNYTICIKHKIQSLYNHFADLGKMVAWLITSPLTGSYGSGDILRKVLPFSIAQEFL
jgi:hypothetical protein